ncbi:hypothetical protein H5410_063914 [Solanum commersonii]|uniref:Uncharacterized protein n=1 Tax=Solanum commersonii TaxID=4109 RepID=A0A9J5W5X8_SOLCO|nr:hypothetical protein H5410_060688 [Solanum commersonii]KAG5574148.1 hypothetical protein H5410_063914 [Solanum commersonii]
MIFEIRKVSFLFRSSPVRATPSSISSCVLFHLTMLPCKKFLRRTKSII